MKKLKQKFCQGSSKKKKKKEPIFFYKILLTKYKKKILRKNYYKNIFHAFNTIQIIFCSCNENKDY